MSSLFKLKAPYKPEGDQPQAIEQLIKRVRAGEKYSTLLGVTGSGKTFTMANVIAEIEKPTLIMSHNKTLAAQLFAEFKHLFPENAVEYFVSYYDYYQPEAYIPQTDTYIEKDAAINDEIEKLRLSATSSLLQRRDVIVVASVSCIYGLGSPEDYEELMVLVKSGEQRSRSDFLKSLVIMQYERNEIDFSRGKIRVRGDVVDVFPAYGDKALRLEFFGDEITKICEISPLTGNILNELKMATIYPAKQFVTPYRKIQSAVASIEAELEERLSYFRKENKLLEAQRLESRTRYDLEMLQLLGHCPGIENYSRHLSDRKPGERPYCLLDFFKKDFLLFVDESHVSIPQVRGMFEGDYSRKKTLVEHGFRLPSAMDNRPLKFPEFEALALQLIAASATPGPYEFEKHSIPIEQVIRPTGLVDPEVVIKPLKNQIDDLIEEIRRVIKKKQRILVTTLTKKMSEDLTDYLDELGLRVKYLHSEINAIQRVDIIRSLRLGEFDVLIGINLLREGLDLPEVSLVAILDADKEGFLRSKTAIIQTAGRAARHWEGRVILYADTVTKSMQSALDEMNRRRELQLKYNTEHNIQPKSIQRAIEDSLAIRQEAQKIVKQVSNKKSDDEFYENEVLYELENEMYHFAENLEFEKAAQIRDKIFQYKKNTKPTKNRQKG